MKIWCLYLVFGEKHIETGLYELKKLINKLFHNENYKIIIINNAENDRKIVDIDFNTVLIEGDNSNREFSGWDRGFKYLSEIAKPSLNDAIIIANDTFHRNYGNDYLKLFRKKSIKKTIEKKGFAGYYDAYPEKITIFGLELQWWLRSSIIIGSYQAFQRILPLSLPFSSEEIFSNDPQVFFKEGSNLSRQYKCYLKGWLIRDYEGCKLFKEAWHSQEPINEKNFGNMKDKARSILCEHYLSAKAQKMRIYMHRINKTNFYYKMINYLRVGIHKIRYIDNGLSK